MNASVKELTRKRLVGLLALGIGLMILGELLFSSGRNAFESWKVFPTVAGLLLILIDGVLALIWFVRRQKPTALEEGLRTHDPDRQI
jgi:hypothetical protein